MSMGIDLIEVKFKKEKHLNFFAEFFNDLSKGQLPFLKQNDQKYFPAEYKNKLLTYLGCGWCFVPDTPQIEKMLIQKEELILHLTITGGYDGWTTIHLMKSMLKQIEIQEYTHYSTHTSTNMTGLDWLRNGVEYSLGQEIEDEEIFHKLQDQLGDNYNEEDYFKLLYESIENGKLIGRKIQTVNINQIDDLNRIQKEEYEMMLSDLVIYLVVMKEAPNAEQKIYLKFFKGDFDDTIRRIQIIKKHTH